MSYNLKTSKEREVIGLVEAMEKFNVKKGLIITQDYESKETIEGNGC
jgi:predicted AAA+ superfamily ATPase